MLGFLFSQTGLLLTITGYLVYKLLTWNHDYFEKRNVKFIKPVPLFGNLLKMTCQLESFYDLMQNICRDYAGHRFIGFFEFIKPTYIVFDPELIKQITIKDFEHFLNHRNQIDENIDPLFSRNLVSMRDNKWRAMRSTLSPAFTGSKMRSMFQLMAECTSEHTDNILKAAKQAPLDMEMKELFQRFGADIIATCSFGIKIDSLKDKTNEFFTHGKRMTNFEGVNGLKFLGFSGYPKLMKLLKIKIIDDQAKVFFQNIVQNNIKYREEHNIVRQDMINLLVQMKKNEVSGDNEDKYDDAGFATVHEELQAPIEKHTIKWDDDDLTAQCMIFFFAGFHTVSTLMSFVTYELAANPDIQQRLRAEIDKMHENLKGSPLTYESLQDMKYLDNVISEALRRWSPAMITDRICTKPYEMVNRDGTKATLNVGDGITFPIAAIHRDPKYWPDPDKFDPERFSNANKDKIVPFTYFPFGTGPRNCIGSRFALMEAKAILYNILLNFRIEKSTKMAYPIKLKLDTVLYTGQDGIWVKMVTRNRQ